MSTDHKPFFKKNKTGQGSAGHLLYAVDEQPPQWISALMGLQMVLLIVGPITVTPIVVARMAGIDPVQYSWIIFASLVASAIGTFIQVRRFGVVGSGYLLFIGTSGTFIACALSAAQVGGMALVATMAVLSAPLQILFGFFLGPLRRIITPVVGGVVIMLIVVSILGIALELMAGQPGEAGRDTDCMLVSAGTLAFVLVIAIFGNKTLRLWSLIIGIFGGTLLAMLLGITDFSQVAQSRWIGLPQGSWPGFYLEFTPEFLSIYLAFALVTIVGAVETLGDSMAIQHISERNFRKIKYERVQGAIYADGIANAVAGALGTLPNTTYSNAISAVELTGVSARRVGYYSALFLFLLAFSPKVASFIASIPSPVVGVFLFLLLAMLFVTGIKLAASQGLSYESGIVIGVSFWVGYSFQNELFFPHLIPDYLAPLFGNGMAVGGLTAIFLSMLFNLKPAGQAKLILERRLEQIDKLQSFINEYAAARRIPSYQLQKLHLTAEELFTHLCTSKKFTSPSLQINIRKENANLQVEFIDSSATRDLDHEVEDLQTDSGTIDPDQIGLLLLGRFASNIRHITIGGINYISYDLSDD